MSDNIPPEIVSDNILTRLPVKSLLRFRCVCKPWLTLIDSPDFVNSHLNGNITTKSNTCVVTIVTINDTNTNIVRAYTLDCALVDRKTAADFGAFRAVPGDIVGTVNGLVCISVYVHDVGSDGGVVRVTPEVAGLVLWNPSTRTALGVPPVSSDRRPGYVPPSFGFGYDKVNDDYKVVRLDQTWLFPSDDDVYEAVLDCDVKVFSLKSMKWTEKEDFPYPLRYEGETGRFVNGAIHWCLMPATSPFWKPFDNDNVILAFDVCSEKYQIFPLPEFPKRIFNTSLVTFEGLLGVVCDYRLDHVDLWVMKEYSVKETWTRLITLDQGKYFRLVVYSKDGRRLLLEENWERLVWYDLKSHKVDECGIRGLPLFSRRSLVYVESLIQLPGPGTIASKDERKEKKTEKNRKKKEKRRNNRDEKLAREFKLEI